MLRFLILIYLFIQPAAAQDTASFRDDFNAFSNNLWGISSGWANGDHQNCMWSNQVVKVERGYLFIGFSDEPLGDRDYTCGEVQSRQHYGYGTYEARLRTPYGSGLNAAFFTYTGPHHGDPHDEIDFEILTKNTSQVHLNTYISGEPHHGKTAQISGAANTGFHTYSFIWENDRVRWFIDGRLVHEAGPPLPQHPQKIILSLWASDTLTDWMGRFRMPRRQPVTMVVDWVAYTRLGEGCRFEASVLCTLQ